MMSHSARSLGTTAAPSASEPNPFVKIAWVRRIGTDASSSLPVHLNATHDSVADILLAAHKILFSSRDGVSASDIEFVTAAKGTPVSNLDSLEMLATLHRLQSQPVAAAAAVATPPKQQAQAATQQQHHHYSFNQPQQQQQQQQYGPVEVFLLARRRQRAIGSVPTSSGIVAPIVDAVFKLGSPPYSPPPSSRNRHQQQQQQQNAATPQHGTTATTPVSRTQTPPTGNRTAARATTPRRTGNTSSSSATTPAAAANNNDQNQQQSGQQQQDQQQQHQSAQEAAAARSSPTRGGRPACDSFAPRWLHNDQCEHCLRPKRLHTAEAIALWENKQRPPSPSQIKRNTALFVQRERTGPLWKPRKVTPKALSDMSPLNCKLFVPAWGREQFCNQCHGPKDQHTRTALEELQKHRDAVNRKRWHSSRPLPTESLEERQRWRCAAPAKRCEAFTPLWNNNEHCALCFCHLDDHAPEKRYFVTSPTRWFAGQNQQQQNAALFPGQRPDFLAVQYSAANSSARNWWLVNFPWRYTVVFLPLEDLFSLSQVARWLCVEIRPLLRSAVQVIENIGVTAHHELKNDAVRIASHLESCGVEARGLLAAAIVALFNLPLKQQNEGRGEQSVSASSAGATAADVVDAHSCEAILAGGTVGSRSALLRKLSRFHLAGTRPHRDFDGALLRLERTLINSNSGGGRQQDDANNEEDKPQYETDHARRTMEGLVRMLRMTGWQCVTLVRARRYLSQDFEPL